VVLMARDALPTIFADREQAEAGGLMSYAPAEEMLIVKQATTSEEPCFIRSFRVAVGHMNVFASAEAVAPTASVARLVFSR
jgi:hypothetical protein